MLVAVSVFCGNVGRTHQFFKLFQASALIAVYILSQHRFDHPAVVILNRADQAQGNPDQSDDVLRLDFTAVICFPGNALADRGICLIHLLF